MLGLKLSDLKNVLKIGGTNNLYYKIIKNPSLKSLELENDFLL